MKIYLVRHGETDWTKQQRLQGRRDIPLNESGRERLLETAKEVSKKQLGIEVMISSPLMRAKESAEIIAREIQYPVEKIITEQLFIERDFGSGEGVVIEDLGHKFPDDSFENMESIPDTCKRAEQAILKVVEEYPDKTVMVVAHGAILKAVLAYASKGTMVYQDETIRIAPGSIYVLEYKDGELSIVW